MDNASSVATLHLSRSELQAGLDLIRQSPQDHGRLDQIVIRPRKNEREVLKEGELSPQSGVHGDGWINGTNPHPQAQVTLMNSRAIALIAQTPDRWALAGDQLYVDLDLSEENLQPGQRLQIGTVILEVTTKPHQGCAKFSSRFGADALDFVNSEVGQRLHLRGIYVAVVQAGRVRVGDVVVKC